MSLKDKGSALEGFFALYDGTGNSEATVFEMVTTKCVLEYDLVQRAQDAGLAPLKGRPIGSIPDLWPLSTLRELLVAHARTFLEQIVTHDYDPLVNAEQCLVSGPFTEKVGPLHEYTPEAGNHLIPQFAQRKAERVWSYQGDELDWSRGCAFLIQGKFTRHARNGRVDDKTGLMVV